MLDYDWYRKQKAGQSKRSSEKAQTSRGAYTATSTAAMGKYNKELLEYYTDQKAKIGAK